MVVHLQVTPGLWSVLEEGADPPPAGSEMMCQGVGGSSLRDA